MSHSLTTVTLLLAMLAAPVGAQVTTDRVVGARGGEAPGLVPFAGRRVAAIDITGHNVTKDWVITREIRTKIEQQWSRISWSWIQGNHVSFDFYGARHTRPDVLRGFEETSYEFTLDVGWSPDFGFNFHFANGTKPKAQRARLR